MWSVRMRAQKEGKHVSGAERLIKEDLHKVILELSKRPKEFDKMVITLERVERVEIVERALPIYSYDFRDIASAHEFAIKKLTECGIKEELALKAIELLRKGPNPKGGNMRGAVLMDIESGERLEEDQERGIRTVRVDWEDRKDIQRRLRNRGIRPYYLYRLMDALAIATKNVYCGVIAELCWSDDPTYTTGYVAGKDIGYVRIKPMKEGSNPIGGRVYFVRREDVQRIKRCLEETALLIKGL